MEKNDSPKIIYLQIDGESWEGVEGVTWCQDQIHDTDIQYVRMDVVAAAMEEMEKEPLLPEYHHECEQIAYTDGTQDALAILRKHLGVE